MTLTLTERIEQVFVKHFLTGYSWSPEVRDALVQAACEDQEQKIQEALKATRLPSQASGLIHCRVHGVSPSVCQPCQDIRVTCPHGCEVRATATKVCAHPVPSKIRLHDLLMQSIPHFMAWAQGEEPKRWCVHHSWKIVDGTRGYWITIPDERPVPVDHDFCPIAGCHAPRPVGCFSEKAW